MPTRIEEYRPDGTVIVTEVADPEPQEPGPLPASALLAAFVAEGIVTPEQAAAVVKRLADPVTLKEVTEAAQVIRDKAVAAALDAKVGAGGKVKG